MDTLFDWLDQDSDTSDEEYSIGNIIPRDDSTEESVSSEGEESLELPTIEMHAATESTDASEMPCAEDQSTVKDSAVAGNLCMHLIYFITWHWHHYGSAL